MAQRSPLSIDDVAGGQNIKEREYWLKKMSGYTGKAIFPYDLKKTGDEPVMETVSFDISGDMASKLMVIINGSYPRLHMFLVTVLTVLLAKYTNNNDIIIGTPIYNPDMEGKFINTLLAIRSQITSGITFKELLLSVKETIVEAVEYQNYRIKTLVYRLNLDYSEIDFPLFDIVLLLENIQDKKYIHPIMPNLVFSFRRINSYIEAKIEYNSRLYWKSTIKRTIHHFNNLLQETVFNIDLLVSSIEILSGEEKKQILYDFNDTAAGYPEDKTLHELFEEQVEKTPDNIALHGGMIEWMHGEEGSITYKNLNEESNRLARLLIEKGVQVDSIVGIMVERSIEMIVGILGILKSRGAYLPIDPEYPANRIRYILVDSSASFFLIYTRDVEPIDFRGVIIPVTAEELALQKTEGVPPVNTAHDLAYVIYTSGSTGKPKGVLIEHRNVVFYTCSSRELIQLTSKDIRLQQSSISFDQFVEEVYPILSVGGKLIILKKFEVQDPERLSAIIQENHITVFSTTPAVLQGLNKFPLARSLRRILVGGDVLKDKDISNIVKRMPVDNFYGPTETTTAATHYHYTGESESGIIPIGKPKNNYQVYILDGNEKPVPIGVSGEIYIAGDGVARGYLNRPQFTAEKFIHNPFSPSKWMYKSGDLGRWLSDGNIEFVGRSDFQVKIRGFRIEMGEIEYLLQQHKAVQEALVIETDKNQLCAYIVKDKNHSFGDGTPKQLIEYLSDYLPNYMIPLYFMPLEKIPLTPNGKVDLKALPKPRMKEEVTFVAPRNPVEKKMAELMADVLEIEEDKIGIESNFFELGGHSLRATILSAKAHKIFKVRIPLEEIFKNPTIMGLSRFIKISEKDIYTAIPSVEKKEYYPLSPAQKRLYILHQMQLDSTAYNMPQFIPLEMDTDLIKIEGTFKKLIAHHENFHTSFYMVNDEPVQRVHESVPFEIAHHHVTIDGAVPPGSLICPFDLTQAPLLRVGLVEPAGGGRGTENRQGQTLLMVDMHHIISDGISHGVLIKDFLALYEGEELLPLRIQYKDFSQWQNREKEKEKIKQQERYWLKEFAREIPVLELPTDYPRPVGQSFEGNSINFEIIGDEALSLKAIALTENSTLFMVLAAVVNILLTKVSGQEDIIIGTPLAGRRHPDLEKIIGMFVNTLSLRNYPAGDRTFREFLGDVKERTLKAFENQEYPFEELVDKLSVKRDIGHNPLFDVMFALQNMNTAGQDEDTEIENKRLHRHDSPDEYENIFQTVKFDLSLTAVEKSSGLFFSIRYRTKLIKKETIERFIAYFKKIVSVTVKEPGIKISEIEIISGEEKNRLLYEFNDTEADYPNNKTLHRLFEEQVERSPDNMAVHGCMIAWMHGEEEKNEETPSGQFANAFGEMQLSYGLLNEESNRLAYTLLEKGVKPDTIVGIMVERSVEMMIGIMGILKAGGAYLPIDPEYPEGRIYYMLADTSASALITTHNSAKDDEKVRRWEGERILLEEILHSPKSSSHPLSFLPSYLQNSSKLSPANSLAYIIYTSGSTGKPKSVMVEHRNVANTVSWFIDIHKVRSDVRILQVSDYTFDASVNQIFGSLISGASLYIASKEIRADIEELRDYIIYHRINIINFVPSLLRELLSYVDKLECLHTVLSGAEKLDEMTKEAIIGKGYRLYNQYGPTETTIDALVFECSSKRVNLGKPISNVKVYILDKYEKVLPIGVVGELYITGAGVARGYLNRPELTAERFICFTHQRHEYVNISEQAIFYPTCHRVSKVIYKSGDLVRWLSDGNIEFHGRIDHQVKIRGFRIELGEIESRLLNNPLIKEAAVITHEREPGEKYLCAYIVSGAELEISELKEYLTKYFPAYMIPTYFVKIEKIPLTPNGKIDKNKLPKPGFAIEKDYVPPRDQVEEKLKALWTETLGIDSLIGINDNFFELGGNSLKATMLVSKIHKELKVKLPMVEIFKLPSIRQLSNHLKVSLKVKYEGINPIEEREYFALSPGQKRLYILHQMTPDNTSYNLPYIIPLVERTEKEKLEAVFDELMRRHESLRTCFITVDDEPVQKINKKVDFSIRCTNISGVNLKHIISNFVEAIDLSKAPLLRVDLLSVDSTRQILLIDMHHILTDRISQGILKKEFMALFSGKRLPPLRLQYKDYAEWQNSEQQQLLIKEQERYWLEIFADAVPVLNLPTDFPRPMMQSFEGNFIDFNIGKEETTVLNAIARSEGATLFMVLLATFNILLTKLSGQEDVVVGTPIAGRRHVDLEKIIGIFINTLSLRDYPAGQKTFREFLGEVKDRTLKDFENQDYPFENLVEKLNLKRDTSRNPLFDVMFLLENIPESTGKNLRDEMQGLGIKPYNLEHRTSRFDLTLNSIEIAGRLNFIFEYSTSLFREETIARFGNYFKEIISAVITNPDTSLMEIEIIGAEERKRLLYGFNDTEIDYPGDKCIHELFAQQVEKTPGNTAVAGMAHNGSHMSLTYEELKQKSNRLAVRLRQKGVKPGTLAGILVERTIEMMIAIIAIMKSGGAYVPLDPIYPPERIKYILEDCSSAVILTCKELKGMVEHNGKTVDISDGCLYEGEGADLEKRGKSGDPAYVIYTSGSTGKPKGVIIEHRSLANFIMGMTHILEFSSDDSILSLTTISFDIFGLETLLPLTKGSKVLIGTREEQLNAEAAARAMVEEGVNILQVTPSRLALLISAEEFARCLNTLKYLVVGGETFPGGLLERIQKVRPGKIYNVYGPTETTIWSTVKEVSTGKSLNIGKPIANTQVYILDKYKKPQPINVAGDLWISGSGLARGYINRVELTGEKFISNSQYQGKILYYTGDTAKWLPDGDIQFLGRQDDQVKIRGFRIELGEIQAQLLKYTGVKEAVVLCKEGENQDKYICAYIVSINTQTEAPSSLELREHLLKTLPDYMIPAYFIRLEKIPLTSNGKIDRKALPTPNLTAEKGYIAPRDEVEKILAEIWAMVLGIKKDVLGIDSNFFLLGGHSLKAIVMTAKIQKEFPVKLSLIDVFKAPTIKRLSERIKESPEEKSKTIKPTEKKEYYPLSSAQMRMYIAHRMEKGNTSYNLPIFLTLKGELNLEHMEHTFKRLTRRHNSLRTSFITVERIPFQVIHDHVDFKVEYDEGSEEEAIKIVQDFIRPFDLSNPPLLRVGVIKTGDSAYILMADMFHIISDAASIEVLIDDFKALYAGQSLPPLKIQYQDFVEWQNWLIRSGKMEKQKHYWLSRFEPGNITVLNLPVDYPRPQIRDIAQGDFITFSLEKELCKKLYHVAEEAGVTLYMLLLSAYNVLLSKYTKQEDIVVGALIAGRSHAGLENVIGMFVNILAMRNSPRKYKTFKDFLMEVKENALRAYENQDYQFEELVAQLGLQGASNRNPLFDTVFTLNAMEENNGKPTNSQVNLEPYRQDIKFAKFDLYFQVTAMIETIGILLRYSTQLFKPSTIRKIAKHYTEVLEQIVNKTDVKLKEITLSHDFITVKSIAHKEDGSDFDL